MRTGWLWCLVMAGCAVDADLTSESAHVDGAIRAVVYAYGTTVPLAGAKVEFVAPDDTVQTAFTDSAGVVQVASPPNTRVLVYQTTEGNYPYVRTFEGANPGDELLVGRARQESFVSLGQITFVQPKRGNQTHYYRLRVSCSPDTGIGDLSRVLTISACPQATDATAVAWVEDALGQPLTGPSVLTHLDLTAAVGGTIRMPAYGSKLTTASAQFTNVPAGATSLSWETVYLQDDDPTIFSSGSQADPSVGTPTTMSLLGVGNRTSSSFRFTPPGFNFVSHVQVRGTRATSYAVDASQLIRPVTYGSFDLATQSISWPSASFGRAATVAYATVLTYTGGYSKSRIDIYAPGDTTHIALPALPPELLPASGDQVYVSLQTAIVGGETYNESLERVSSRNFANPFLWEPTYSGEVWTASW